MAKLPGINYNVGVPNLGRHDIYGPLRVARAQAQAKKNLGVSQTPGPKAKAKAKAKKAKAPGAAKAAPRL